MNDKLYIVKVFFSSRKEDKEAYFSIKTEEFPIEKETEKTITYNDFHSNRINKKDLMVLKTTLYNNSLNSLAYHTFCLEDKLETAKEMCIQGIRDIFNGIEEQYLKGKKVIDKDPSISNKTKRQTIN